MKLTSKTITEIRKAARRVSSAMSGRITRCELASRYADRAAPKSAIVTNLLDVDIDRTELHESLLMSGRGETIEDGSIAGAAIVEVWTYSGVDTPRVSTRELEDTVYVGVVDGHAVDAHCDFARVHRAVLAAADAR